MLISNFNEKRTALSIFINYETPLIRDMMSSNHTFRDIIPQPIFLKYDSIPFNWKLFRIILFHALELSIIGTKLHYYSSLITANYFFEIINRL